ncbi:MAG: protein YgfX [Thiobacillus sp.]
MHEIECKPSRWLGLLQAGMAVLALVAVWHAALTQVGQIILSGGVVGLLWRSRQATRYLRLRADGSLQWREAAGEWQDAGVEDDSVVNRWMLVMRLRVAGQVDTVVILPDSVPADDMRRLRVALRWARHTHLDTASPDAD